jgi:hypothetical protein
VGRGGHALLDVDAIAAWRRQQDAKDALTVLAAELPELVAEAMSESFRLVDGAHKRASADLLTGAWYVVTTKLLEHIGEKAPVRGIEGLPETIKNLRRIAEGDHINVQRAFFEWQQFPQLLFNVSGSETKTRRLIQLEETEESPHDPT